MVPDLDDYVTFETRDEALAAAKRDHRPVVFVQYSYNRQTWGICDRGQWLLWSELPFTVYAMSDELPSVLAELADIWEVSADDFVHCYTEGGDLKDISPCS